MESYPKIESCPKWKAIQNGELSRMESYSKSTAVQNRGIQSRNCSGMESYQNRAFSRTQVFSDQFNMCLKGQIPSKKTNSIGHRRGQPQSVPYYHNKTSVLFLTNWKFMPTCHSVITSLQEKGSNWS